MTKFCPNCGTELKSIDQDICLNCGTYLKNGTSTSPIATEDHGNIGFMVLSIFFPIVGLILYLVNKDTKPVTAKQAGKGALIGIGVSAGIFLLFFILGIVIYSINEAESSYYYYSLIQMLFRA